jgi:hypothetical protein
MARPSVGRVLRGCRRSTTALPLGDVGSLHNLPQNRHLLVGQLLATVCLVGSEICLQITQSAQEWLESLARLRPGIGLLASRQQRLLVLEDTHARRVLLVPTAMVEQVSLRALLVPAKA